MTKLFCKIVAFLKKNLCNWTSRQTKLMIMINKDASTKVMKFMAPRVRSCGVRGPDCSGNIVNMHYFFSRPFLYYLASFGRTIDKKGDF